jgi:hypothetical protein
MYQQREPPRIADAGGLWEPRVVGVDEQPIEFEPDAADRYTVVDEIIGGDVRLAVAPWPHQDDDGRLRFEDGGSEPHEYSRAELQGELDRHRAAEGQLVRPLRIGDVFLVRGFGDLADWRRVLDVTGASRQAAKRAGLRAVAQPADAGAAEGGAAGLAPERGWRRLPQVSGPGAEPRPLAEPSAGSIAHAVV